MAVARHHLFQESELASCILLLGDINTLVHVGLQESPLVMCFLYELLAFLRLLLAL